MFCWHKYMAADGNVQSCYKCGRTRIIRCTSHTLEDKEQRDIVIDNRRKRLQVQRCIRCGRYFNFSLTDGEYEGDSP